MTEPRHWPEPWTAFRVMARMREATTTLRIVGTSYGPSRAVTWWPDVVRSSAEAYGYTPESAPRMRASAEQITRMDEVLNWVTRWLTEDACTRAGLVPDGGWLVMARASGWSFEHIGRMRKVRYGVSGPLPRGHVKLLPGGNSRKSLMLIESKTLAYVATQLNLADVAVDRNALEAEVPYGMRRSARESVRVIAPARTSALGPQIQED